MNETGEVCWSKFPKPGKKRLVLILTRTAISDYLGEVTVAPLARTVRNIPSEVLQSPEDGVPEECAVNCDHLHTVSRGRIGPLITTLSPPKMRQVAQAVGFALELRPAES